MRPRCKIDSVFTYNTRDEEGNYIPTKITIGSWITLQPGKRGDHARDASKNGGTSGFRGVYKAKVLKFGVAKGSSVVSEVLVQHAYMHRQLLLEPSIPSEGSCNYLYLSPFEDWVDITSIIGVIWVTHAEIGEAQRGTRTHKELLDVGVFFFNALYIPSSGQTQFGCLQSLPLPSFDSPDWPLSDMATSEQYRFRMRADFLVAMRPNTGSRATHLQWFMPVHVMVDLFSTFEFRKTPTLFVFKDISDECFTSVMDDGWDVKISAGVDIIKCVASRQSVIFKFHVGRSILYVNFLYNRQRLIQGSSWKNIDQTQVVDMVKLECEIEHEEEKIVLDVGLSWNLSSVRQEIQMVQGQEFPRDFSFWILENGIVIEKVNIWNEKNKIVAEVILPKVIRVVPQLE